MSRSRFQRRHRGSRELDRDARGGPPGRRDDPELPINREGLDNHALVLLMAARLDSGSTFVDIGANEGRFLYAARRIAPQGRHFAFEPLPELAAVVQQRFPEVTVHNLALSDTTGTAGFVRVVEDPGYSGLIERPYPGEYRTEKLDVRVERLDDVLPQDVIPAFVKIDVEGAELGVLRGAIQTLRRSRPWIVFEHQADSAAVYDTKPWVLWDVLCEELGLKVYDLDGHGPLLRADFEHVVRNATRWNFLARP